MSLRNTAAAMIGSGIEASAANSPVIGNAILAKMPLTRENAEFAIKDPALENAGNNVGGFTPTGA